jgi:large subunit ribosomal protein L35
MEPQMPKMKTKSAAKKRFTVTATGKVKFKQAHARHRLISKTKKMKRKAKGTAVMFKSDGDKILNNFLPYLGAKRRKGRAKARPVNDNTATTQSQKAGA